MALYDPSSILNLSPTLLFVIIVWSLIWKGIALWKSAHKEQPIWFVVLLVINTLGLLEILYIFIFSKMNSSNAEIIRAPNFTKAKTTKKKVKKKSKK